MAKENESTKKTGKKTGTTTRRTAAASAKKQSPAPKKTKTAKPAAKQTKTSASAGWKEKKAQIRERSKGPKTLAEQKANQGKGPIRRFLSGKSGWIDLAAIPLFTFSILCLYSIAGDSDREAAVWCAQFSRNLFGIISYLVYCWLAAFCVRLWLRNFNKFREIHYKRWLYFLGLFFFLALVLQYNANKHIPPLPASENGGGIANLVVTVVTNVLGNSGMVILLIFLTFFFIWQAWKFLAARERAMNSKEQEVPVRVYWENIRTAAEAEEMEAEQQRAAQLTSDIETDFRSTVGLLSAREPDEDRKSSEFRREAGNGLRKLRETFKEISQPAPDKEAMIPKEPPAKKKQRSAEAEVKPADRSAIEKPVRKPAPRRRTAPEQLPLTPTPAEELPEEKPVEPVFEENPDHNGSGLLSAPAPAPELTEEMKLLIEIRDALKK